LNGSFTNVEQLNIYFLGRSDAFDLTSPMLQQFQAELDATGVTLVRLKQAIGLTYGQFQLLWSNYDVDDPGRGTAKALAWLRTNYTKPFRLDELAAIARMGVST
jgi:hypothetical protein